MRLICQAPLGADDDDDHYPRVPSLAPGERVVRGRLPAGFELGGRPVVPHAATVGLDHEGRTVLLAAVRVAYHLATMRPLPRAAQPAVARCDRFDARGAPLALGELGPVGTGTSLVLRGRVPLGAPSRACSLRFGPITRHYRLFGPRVVEANRRISAPRPASHVSFEASAFFGGPGSPYNPVGVGLVGPGQPIAGDALPSIEDLADGLVDHDALLDPQRPVTLPTGVPLHWKPRRAAAGSLDARWASTRAPLMASDARPSLHDVSALVAPRRGRAVADEARELVLTGFGEREGEALTLELPPRLFYLQGPAGVARFERSLVWIDLSERLVHLGWRASLPCEVPPRGSFQLFEKRYHAPIGGEPSGGEPHVAPGA
jgi:hypothetical protein